MEEVCLPVQLPPFCSPSLSFPKWLLSQTLGWLLKLALFFRFLESNQLVYENHLPLSGQQWLLQLPLCLQVELKRHQSLPIPQGQKAAEAGLLKCLSEGCRYLPSFSRNCAKWPFLTGNVQEGWNRHSYNVPLIHFFATHCTSRCRNPCLW